VRLQAIWTDKHLDSARSGMQASAGVCLVVKASAHEQVNRGASRQKERAQQLVQNAVLGKGGLLRG
jgi:hypothetical protein